MTVVGLAKSGVAAARLLRQEGAEVRATDAKPRESLGDAPAILEANGVRLFLGGHPDACLDGVDLVVTSPGVPEGAKPLADARARGIEVIGELELAWRMFGGGYVPLIAITGSNGKSTTTALTGHLLEAGGIPAWVGGNLGTPLSEFHLTDFEVPPRWIVVEVSSFMLETAPTFAPRMGCVLNVSPNHLDRHPSIEVYAGLKARIWDRAGSAIYNADDPLVSSLAQKAPGQKLSFGTGEGVDARVTRSGKHYSVRVSGGNFPLDRFPCPGEHNAMNAAAALLMASMASAYLDRMDAGLASFRPLEHRLEKCGEANGVSFYNDSKATTTAALGTSIAVFDKSIVLAGGKDKGGDWDGLRGAVHDHVKRLVAYGAARERIAGALAGTTDVRTAQNLPAAFSVATEGLVPGDVVVLSPGCASYDQFANFEERGRAFKALVAEFVATGGGA